MVFFSFQAKNDIFKKKLRFLQKNRENKEKCLVFLDKKIPEMILWVIKGHYFIFLACIFDFLWNQGC